MMASTGGVITEQAFASVWQLSYADFECLNRAERRGELGQCQSFAFFGTGGGIATSHMRDQDTATRAARLLQLSLVSISPRAVQSDLRSPGVVARLPLKDYRSLSPLISTTITP